MRWLTNPKQGRSYFTTLLNTRAFHPSAHKYGSIAPHLCRVAFTKRTMSNPSFVHFVEVDRHVGLPWEFILIGHFILFVKACQPDTWDSQSTWQVIPLPMQVIYGISVHDSWPIWSVPLFFKGHGPSWCVMLCFLMIFGAHVNIFHLEWRFLCSHRSSQIMFTIETKMVIIF